MQRALVLFSLALLAACTATTGPGASTSTPVSTDGSAVASTLPSSTTAPPSAPAPTPALARVIEAALPETPVALPKVEAVSTNIPAIPEPAAPAASVSKRVELADAENLDAITEEYGITLTDAQRSQLEERAFVLLPLPSTSLRPDAGMADSEYAGYYKALRGPESFKDRTQANSVLYTSDVFLATYNRLFEELLKEAENTVFFPKMQGLSERLYEAANARAAGAKGEAERARWERIRAYYAIPHCILEQGEPIVTDGSPEDRLAQIAADEEKDAQERVDACVRDLDLGDTEAAALATVDAIYAGAPQYPPLFADEFRAYSVEHDREFLVDFTQFTPRSHYTGSSLRRQYFRAMSWYIQVPFYVESPELTAYAVGIAELLGSDAQGIEDYAQLDEAIRFLVGGSDDLGPIEYLQAVEAGRGEREPAVATMAQLRAAPDPQVRSSGATATTMGLTKGMRFLSGKTLQDSIWTSRLTQGDEDPMPGYTQKLPPMASSVQIMSLLGNSEAARHIDGLVFITDANRDAVHQALRELQPLADAMTDADWQRSAYGTELWALRGMFQWEDAHRRALPAFMQSPVWEVKTLQTASGAWTELRHATLLYAKQSFAELGGLWDDPCDRAAIPPPAKGYVEPQPVLYARLAALGSAVNEGVEGAGLTGLRNAKQLQKQVQVLEAAAAFSRRELADEELTETLKTQQASDPETDEKMCPSTTVVASDWEDLRDLATQLADAQPILVAGEILMAKDVRAAKVADVHTGIDSVTPPFQRQTTVLYEATGVPHLILALVGDANGTRAVVGLTYSHYETYEGLEGPRKTDEQWQANFYTAEPTGYEDFAYTPVARWPAQPAWYAPLFGPTE